MLQKINLTSISKKRSENQDDPVEKVDSLTFQTYLSDSIIRPFNDISQSIESLRETIKSATSKEDSEEMKSLLESTLKKAIAKISLQIAPTAKEHEKKVEKSTSSSEEYKIVLVEEKHFLSDSGEDESRSTAIYEEEPFSLNEIKALAKKYGIRKRDKRDKNKYWSSEFPVEDKEYFENGVEKYYTLHIKLNGKEISNEEFLKLNNLMEK